MNKILKFTILLIAFSLFNCEKEIVESNQLENSQKTSPFTIKTIGENEINNNPSIIKQLGKFNKKTNSNVYGRDVHNSEYDFTVNTDNVKLVEATDGTVHSYTFLIDPVEENSAIENLVITSQEDGTYKSEIVVYTFLDNNQLEIKSAPLENFDTSDYLSRLSFSCATTVLYSSTYNEECNCQHIQIDSVESSCEYFFDTVDSDGGGYNSGGWENTVWTGGGGGGGGSSSGSGASTTTTTTTVLVQNRHDDQFNAFTNSLNNDQQFWLLYNTNAGTEIFNYLIENSFSDESENFASNLINVLLLDDDVDINALNFVLEAKNQDKIYNEFDSAFLSSVNPFIAIDTSNHLGTLDTDPLYIHFMMRCVALRVLHPDWSDIKIYWEASKDFVHLTLDGLGLIPVFGEPADIINGVIYTFEGDTLNASLSYAGAIPFVGWLSTGAKVSIKVINQTTQGVIGLIFRVSDSGFITFGDRNILKHVIGSAGTGLHAHHIIPWAKGGREIVQKAANSAGAFNMNSFLNGIPLPSTQHLTGHPIYSNKIDDIFEYLDETFPDMSPNEAYNHLEALTTQIKNLINNNQTLNLGQIADLIVYP